jgi:hypothetical protein
VAIDKKEEDSFVKAEKYYFTTSKYIFEERKIALLKMAFIQ